MDTCFQPLDLNGVRPGDQPVSWQVPAIEEYNRLASETHDTLERDFAGILPNPDAQLELQNSDLEEAVVATKAFGDLVGKSAALRHTVGQIDVVAPTEASVLILGETGTGKELVAREIHRRSAAQRWSAGSSQLRLDSTRAIRKRVFWPCQRVVHRSREGPGRSI